MIRQNSYMSGLGLQNYIFIFAILVGTLVWVTPASQGQSLDDEVNEISKLLMCPVCQGQSVAESNSNLANDMRQIVRKQLREGKNKDEILAYFVESYGETILAAPPVKGVNWLLWILPGLAIVIGLFGIGYFLHQSASTKNEDDAETVIKGRDKEGSYLDKIDEELKREDS